MADTKTEAPKTGTGINQMDRADWDKAATEKAKADKEAYEKSLKEAPAAPTPTQEEADAMKLAALGQAPEGTPVSKREAKAEPASSESTYKTR